MTYIIPPNGNVYMDICHSEISSLVEFQIIPSLEKIQLDFLLIQIQLQFLPSLEKVQLDFQW